MSASKFLIPVRESRAITTAPVPFDHHVAPVQFTGLSPLQGARVQGAREDLRFTGRTTRPNRFPVEAAVAMNEVRQGRVGHHVDTRC